MEEFQLGNMKAEKASAIGRYNLFTTISKTIRIVELCLALFLFSWILTRLPFALHISAQYFRNLFLSPLFVFALSNAIIAALLAQSARHTSPLSAAEHDGAGIYQEFLNHRAAKPPPETDASQPSAAGEVPVECQDKEVISETARIDLDRTVEDLDTCTDKDMVVDDDDDDDGVDFHSGLSGYRRSLSEKWEGDVAEKMLRRELRRSETDKRREGLYPQDELSNEEFQLTIEAFIAKQMRFLKEESSAIVVQNPS